MAQLYGPPSNGSVIPHELEDAIAADLEDEASVIGGRATAAFHRRSTPAGVGRREGTFDSSRFLYTPPGASLEGLRSAIAPGLTGAGLARVAWIGHSIVAGYGATPGADSAPILVRDALATKYGVSVGSGLVAAGTYVPGDPDDSRYTYDPAVWTQLGTVRTQNVQLHRATGTLGAVMTFTSATPGTIVDIYSFGNGKTFDFTIDGGAVQTFTPNGQGAVQKATVTGLPNTVHTVQITATQTGNYTFVLGVDVRPAAGIDFAGIAAYGSIVSDWLPTNNGGAFFNPHKDVLSFSPDVILVQLGANELIHNRGAAELEANMTTLVSAFLAKGKRVALVVDPPIEDATRTNWATEFRSVLYDVADAHAIPLVDLTAAWGSRAESSALYFDQWHPNAAGYQAIADVVGGALFR